MEPSSTSSSPIRALIVRKTTNLEWFGAFFHAQVQSGQISGEELERLSHAHNEHYATLSTLRRTLQAGGIAFDETNRQQGHGHVVPFSKQYNVVIAVGGDGTLLAASHHTPDNAILIGIRSSSTSVGYLCAGDADHIARIIDALLKGGLATIKAARLKARVRRAQTLLVEETPPILNDFLYCNLNPAATTRYVLHMRGIAEEQKSSGMWISTATGSTAAIGAAGGVEQDRQDQRFQYLVREPFRGLLPQATDRDCKLRLIRDFFDPDQEELRIENRCDRAILALDGQHGEVALRLGDRITFHRSHPVNLAIFKH